MVIGNLRNMRLPGKDVMDLHPSESLKLEPGTGRSWIVVAGSFCFVLLQSACTAVTAISGLRSVDWPDVSDRGFAHSRLHLYDSYRPHPYSHADRRRCRVSCKSVCPMENSFAAVPAIIAVENSTSDFQTAPVREVSVRSLRPHTCAGCRRKRNSPSPARFAVISITPSRWMMPRAMRPAARGSIPV